MGAALTHEPAASDIPRAFKGKMEILKKPTGAISGYQGAMKAGLLTAGEINDFSKWKLWNDLGTGTLNIYKKQWLLNLYKRYSVMVINRSRIPLVNASVKLWREKQLLWEQTTDNTGKAELWLQAMDSAYAQQEDKLWIEVIYGERTKAITHIKSIEKGINKIVFSDACREWNQADIAFIVDATGSMGDEINYLKTELQDVMQQCKTMMPKTNFRLGAVFYRDRGDDYITRCTPLNPDPNLAIQFIQNQRAGGGGDEPEGVDTALSVALSELDWNPDAVARLAFLVLDAPPHSDPFTQQRLVHLTKAAARQGIRLIPLTASGIGKTTEYLMRTLALATNGTYLFLTDDSGIGESHLKPSTDQYKVELLNNLLIRIIRNYTWHPGCDESTIQLPDTANSLADTVLIQEPTDTMPQEVSYFRAYPNPTEGLITLETGKFQGALYLTDMNGKILERFDLENGERLSLDLGQYPPGIYYFKYLMEKGSKDLKVILIRP
jgi:hypothetical protein